MEPWTGLSYDAVGIEHNFAILFGDRPGQRGRAWDADVFRSGDRHSIGKLLVETAAHLEKRAQTLKFHPEERENGGLGARLTSTIKSLAGTGHELISQGGVEREDYHWLIVGEMVLLIASLFDYAESRI